MSSSVLLFGSEKAGVERCPRCSETPPSPGGDMERRVAEWILSRGGMVTVRAGEQGLMHLHRLTH